jgi:DeoR family transcriptional regulator, copper-sensing transcriptional repressor
MSNIPKIRREQILSWLRESQTLTIDDLSRRLDVSIMTIHRDLDAMVRAGLVHKVHGGVTLPDVQPVSYNESLPCKCCNSPVSARTLFVIQGTNGEQVQTCCPHCGLLHLGKQPNSALAKDFLYGRMVDARRAIYLMEADVTLCCVPSVLCFATQEDAIRFQQGFNGTIMSFDQAWSYLKEGTWQVRLTS